MRSYHEFLLARASKFRSIAILVSSLLVLTACSGAKRPDVPNMQTSHVPPAMQSTGSGIGTLFTFGRPTGENTPRSIPVNAYLWRASLDTLSFMPLASADPFAGVIVTDWYSPPGAPNERFKITAYVLGNTLAANNVKVSVFRQVDQSGTWISAPVNPATARGIEDRILARAAQLNAAGQING